MTIRKMARRHTRRDMEDAVRLAAEYGLEVRLEPDGAIVFSPEAKTKAGRVNNGLESWDDEEVITL